MPIIDTNKNLTPLEILFRRRKFVFLTGLIFAFCILHFSGCIPRSSLHKAKEFAHRSEVFYEKAIQQYQDLISGGKGTDEIYLKLSQLYFDHGDYDLAVKQLLKCEDLEAKKLLAISYYKLGEFTDALGQFERLGNLADDAYLYYYGLTSERLNLYDKAQDLYTQIEAGPYQQLAKKHIRTISQFEQRKGSQDLDIKLKKIIQNAPDKSLYPQASAIILLSDEEMEITRKNSAIYEGHFIIKILDERGRDNFSEVVIGYDSTYEKPHLEYARTIKPDGEIVEVGKKHLRDVSKYLNFPLYSNARALIISMPEVSQGAIIEYKLKIYKNRLINKKDFLVSYLLQESEPIIQANFRVIIPENRTLYIRTLNEEYNNFNAELKPKISKTERKITYDWGFKDIPQIISEPNMPAITKIDPIFLISTFNSWDTVYNWWQNLAEPKIKPDTQIKRKVKELIKDKTTDEEKLRAIYNFCAQKIRYVAVEYGRAGYEPHRAEDIFFNKYGDCKDQAILLVTMLRQANFLAYPVLIGTKDYFNLLEDFPSVLFNHCIACVELDGKYIFLDPTLETCPFRDLPLDDQDRKVLIFKEDGFDIQTTPLFAAEHNRIERKLKIEIDEGENIHALREVFSFGFYNQMQRAWLLYTQPEMIRQVLEEIIQEISIGSKLKEYKIENLENLNKSVILRYTFQGPEYWTEAGNLRILPQLASLDNSIAAKESRDYPIDLELFDTEELYFEITFPSTFKIKYLPKGFLVKNQWLEFNCHYSHQGNTIYFRQMRILKKKEINVLEYPEFKKFYQNLLRQIKQRIVLEREG